MRTDVFGMNLLHRQRYLSQVTALYNVTASKKKFIDSLCSVHSALMMFQIASLAVFPWH